MDPAGDLTATPFRGTLLGNRGVLHNASGVIVRRSQVRRWITCELEFRGRRRPLMTPGRYTELFFLDEAVALAAGHRPCAECRWGDYQRYRSLWAGAPAADEMDAVLARERALVDGRRVTVAMSNPPTGAFVVYDGGFWVVVGAGMHRWGFAGYTDRVRVPEVVDVVTPPATVAVLAAGYVARVAV